MEPRRHDLRFDEILHVRRQVSNASKTDPDLRIKVRNAGLTPLEVLGSTRVARMGLKDAALMVNLR